MSRAYELYRADDKAVHEWFDISIQDRTTLDEPQSFIDRMGIIIERTRSDGNEHGFAGHFSNKKIITGREEEGKRFSPRKTFLVKEQSIEEKKLEEIMALKHSSIGYTSFLFHTHPVHGLTAPSPPDLAYYQQETHGYISNLDGVVMCILRDYDASDVKPREWKKTVMFDRFNEDPEKMKHYFIYKEMLISPYEVGPQTLRARKLIRKHWIREAEKIEKTFQTR